jgi:hypothetical protein
MWRMGGAAAMSFKDRRNTHCKICNAPTSRGKVLRTLHSCTRLAGDGRLACVANISCVA